MKKNFIKIGVLVTLLSAGVMTGCGPTECEHEGGTATCTQLAVCTKCGESYGEYGDHNYSETYLHTDEQHWKECACGDKIELADHNFVAGEVTKEATCTEEGSQVYNCVCGATKTEVLAVIPHEYATTYSHDETSHWFECSCGDKKDVVAHEFVAGEVTKEATCTEEGEQIYNCVCGATKTEVLAVIPHEYATTYSHDETSHWFECSCGDKKDVVAHEFVAGEVTKEATCTEEGEQIYNCVCGETKTEVIPVEPHSYVTTKFDDTQHWKECACGDKIETADHEFVPGDITKEATCTEKGTQVYICACGASKDVELDTIPHKDEDLDIYCDYGCKKKIIPPYDTLLTCKTANALANAMISLSGNHYVQGEVVEVSDAKNGIFLIKDDSQETFKLRLVKGEGGIAYKDFECQIIVGDYIKAYGKISRDTTSPYTPRMEGPIVTYITQHPHVYGDATCLLPATCECGHTQGEPLGHEDKTGDGLCDRCQFDLNNELVTLNTWTKEGMTQVDDNTLSWSNDILEFRVERGTSSQLYVDAQEHCRIYKGNAFSVTIKNDIAAKTLKFLTTASNYANNIITSLKAKDVTGVLDGTNVVVEDVNTSSLYIPNTAGSIRITGIEVLYAKPAAEKEPTVVDFNTITTTQNSGGDAGYTKSYTTASGWVTANAAIQVGGSAVINPAYPVIGPDNTHKAVCLNGKKSAPGTLTSPTLTGGLEEINVDYTKIFTDTKLSVTITVTELATGNVYTHTIAAELPKDEKYVIYSDSWKLETPVTGDYTIVFKNDCPSNSTSNKDRMTLLKVEYK